MSQVDLTQEMERYCSWKNVDALLFKYLNPSHI